MEKTKLLNKIEDYIIKKDYVSARKLIRNDLKRIGTKYEYYFYMGIASTDADERMRNFKQAYEIEPNNLDIIINLANANDEQGNYDIAIKGYNKALELDNKNALVYNNRGFSYFHKGEYENALNDYNKALSLSPKLKIAQYNKDELIKLLKDDEKYTEIIKQSNEKHIDYKYYFNLGIQEANLGNTNEAMIAYNKSLEIKPDFAPTYMFIGILEFQKTNYEKAREYYTKAINCDTNLVDAYFNRAQIVFATKTENKQELESALEDLQKAIELDNKFIDAYYSIAVIYKNLGNYKEAIENLDKILEIDEQSVNARALKKLLIKKYLN